ncbi:CBL-interacting protein kinase 7 [Cocos nucifera]|uniref:non-specific serine/threonine protein kinase n=1 Tax=Cocos nucifera TaxID=13894 RepID=A0A8K0N3I4_COCNU|nr:CBL-interacting protein kinase 7 [Cocos nucifera]
MDLRRRSKPVPTPPKRHHKPEVLLGRYELGRLLGRGTFAKVYYARSLADGSGVAVKVLDKPEVVETGMASRVLREVSAMRRLSHPNILKLHEVMATKSKIYLVMEHAAGGDLLSLMARRGRLAEPVARRYFQQLVAALRYCHARGVAHRDIKPQNLLLDRHGNLKVSDFGLSALPDQLGDDGRLHTACGTPAYTAPEIVRRKGYDGAKADAWSCGVILFVLLAGSLPFDDANLAVMYKKVHKREYEFPPWISGSARRLVARLLDPNPETRMTIEALADHPWFKRSLSLDSQLSLMDLPPSDGAGAGGCAATAMNAFDIISLSSGLDLSGLFDDGKKRGKRFTSTASVETIMRRIEEIGAKLGYLVERRKGGAVGLGKWGSVVLVVEVSEVVSPLLLVELRVEDGSAGDGEELGWGELKAELGDIVFAWHGIEDS